MFTPSAARLMQQVVFSVFISTNDGVWEAQEMLSKRGVHKSGSNAKYSSICFKRVVTEKPWSVEKQEK